MQLHRLEMTAFGPFADTVVVDFDALSDARVFLLCGDTGAGKTTVLDGVCFGLYGDVPSARATAKQLRSHHAADGVAPRVVLDMSVADRRFRFTRSPAWQRPKKRGAGTTTEPARALVEELVGEWTLRTNRLDEAGQLVGRLLGMTLGQFSQVVLLPQGRFDAFLRASSEDRQKVLTQLFQTARFEQVERWFAERRLQLGRDNRRHHGAVAGVVHRLSEASGVAAPDSWNPEDLTEAASSGAVGDWADGLLDSAVGRHGSASTDLAEAAAVRARTETTLVTGRRTAELVRRLQAARAEREQLARSEEDAHRSRTRLAAARRAAPVAALGPVVEDAARSLDGARTQASAALLALAHALGSDPESVRDQDLGALEEQAGRGAAAARAFLPRAEEAQEARARCLERCDALVASLEHSRERLATLPEQRSSLVTDLTEVRRVAERRAVHEGAAVRSAEQLEAATSVEQLSVELAAARTAEAGQLAVAQARRECWLEVREQRLNGMAAELAAAMVVGGQCPVCGSPDHPAPAQLAEGAPTRADEQVALKASDDAQVELETHRDRVRGLEARLAAAHEITAGRPTAELAADLAAARAEVDRCHVAEGELARLEQQLAVLDEEAAALGREVAGSQAELTAARTRAEELATAVHRLSAELADLLGGEGGRADGLREVIAGHEELRSRAAAARQALAEVDRCASHHTDAVARIGVAAASAGFDDTATALAARLPGEELAALEQAVRDRDRREQEVHAVLADPEVVAAGAADLPPLAALDEAHELADLAHTEAAGVLRVAESALIRLRERSRELDEVLARWAPAREEYSTVRRLAELVEGKGNENTRQMRLSAYVLSSRLGQVVAAANERLAGMTDSRYVLEHSAVRAAGDRRGGLSLLVADQWTDERRDPVTLSGGETFVVSLALALGLADVVTAESGGTHIDTLFVDEGFGSLDADTLEQVMETLDQLRERGRVVGVVSHVADMRDRIPTQLQVLKGRAGSSLRHVC